MLLVGLVLIVLLVLIMFDFSFVLILVWALCTSLFAWFKWYCYLIAGLGNCFCWSFRLVTCGLLRLRVVVGVFDIWLLVAVLV